MSAPTIDSASTPAFRLGEQVRVSETLVGRPRVAGRTGTISRPPHPISWPSYFRTETTAAGTRRVYWVEFAGHPLPGMVESAEVGEADLLPA